MAVEARLAALLAPPLEALGYELVRVKLSGGTGRRTLQVMAEPLLEPSEAPLETPRRFMTVDDCTAISRAIEPILDVEDVVEGAYSLEVSSPGLDRPLLTAAQFRRFAGFEAKVETKLPVAGRKRWVGRIVGVASDPPVEGGAAPERLRLDAEGEVIEFDLDLLDKAKLVITDELIAAAEDGRL